MSRKVLFDTNQLIYALDRGATSSISEAQKAEIRNLLTDPDVEVAISPLIRYEVLRGIKWAEDARYATLKAVLDHFPEREISRDVSELATNLYRLDVHEDASLRATGQRQATEKRNFEKLKFDAFHFATAKIYDLELVSDNERDMKKLDALYAAYQAAQAESAN